jgi:LPS-assembly lipoprotein
LSSSPKRAASLLALLALAGCGFTPLYGGDGGQEASAQLGEIAVNNIPDRTGQMLRISLETKLHANGAPVTELYALTVSYGIATTDIGVLQDSATTYSRMAATANWRLTPIGDPAHPLTTGTATALDSANIIDQQYFALTMETETVNQRLADSVAAQIATQLAIWFRNHPSA